MPADTAGKVGLLVVKKECTNLTCCFRAGDSQKAQDRLVSRMDQRLKHRVSDGAEVRKLEARIEILERALKTCLPSAVARKDQVEVDRIKTALNGSCKKKDKER